MSNSTEVAYNLALARLLRHEGLNAQGEQRHTFGHARGQADVLLDFDDYAVVIEAEFGAPAKADADKRFPPDQPAMVGGLPLRLAVAVGYPEGLADLPESDTDSNLAAAKDLKISYRYYGDEWGPNTVGTVALLAEQLRNYWVQSDNGARIEEIVQKASTAIDQVAEVLARLDRNRGRKPESPGTKALIWLNALVFQELLARHLDMSLLPPEHRRKTISRPDPAGSTADLERQWEEILAINWWPIFHVARETLRATPGSQASRLAMVVLIRTAREIVESGMIRRHDVAGRVFHRLLDSRKFLATNYTTIPAAIMLAGLAFDERGPKWSEIDFASAESVAGLRIVDPACGSGTLLMAAAQEVLKRARRAGAPAEQAPTIVRTILEEALYGFDVVPAAIHLAASTLCMAEARQVVKDMNLWRVQHDVADGVARLGSLDFLSTSPSRGNAAPLGLFDNEKPSIRRVTGTGEVDDSRVGGRLTANIPAGDHVSLTGAARSATPALWLDLAGSCRQSGKTGWEWREVVDRIISTAHARRVPTRTRLHSSGSVSRVSQPAGLGPAEAWQRGCGTQPNHARGPVRPDRKERGRHRIARAVRRCRTLMCSSLDSASPRGLVGSCQT
ncbi:MAG: hypothetical protein OXJ54_09165 [Gemmatimonadetes bacterium]|nr:hypothetical protein [Candidatus Palauibacter rhopaloidicola]